MSLLDDAAHELLVSSLTGRAAQMREDERRCRFAYSKVNPLRDSAIRLADVYARAAELFEQELALLVAQPLAPHAEPVPDPPVGTTASGGVVHRVRPPAEIEEWARDVELLHEQLERAEADVARLRAESTERGRECLRLQESRLLIEGALAAEKTARQAAESRVQQLTGESQVAPIHPKG